MSGSTTALALAVPPVLREIERGWPRSQCAGACRSCAWLDTRGSERLAVHRCQRRLNSGPIPRLKPVHPWGFMYGPGPVRKVFRRDGEGPVAFMYPAA